MFHLSIRGYCKTRPHRSYCFLSMFKLYCKRHYRNLAGVQHVKKTAPARCRHAVGGGGAPIGYDRRRRRQQNVGAAAHSSSRNSTPAFLTSVYSEVPCLPGGLTPANFFYPEAHLHACVFSLAAAEASCALYIVPMLLKCCRCRSFRSRNERRLMISDVIVAKLSFGSLG